MIAKVEFFLTAVRKLIAKEAKIDRNSVWVPTENCKYSFGIIVRQICGLEIVIEVRSRLLLVSY